MKKLLVFVVLLAVGAGAAYHFGYLERLMDLAPHSRFIARDSALRAYFRPDTREWMLVQATELAFPLAGEDREKFEKEVEDFHAKTGIHVVKDVDAAAMSLELGVMRGRFDWSRLSAYLQSQGYTLTEFEGAPAAVKSKAMSLALDGRYLLVGSGKALKQALVRKRQGQGMDEDSPLVKALEGLGWKHGMVGGVIAGSPLASLPNAMGLQANALLTTFDVTEEHFEVRGVASTGSERQGELLRAALEALRQVTLVGMALDESPEAHLAREALQQATLEADAEGTVRGTLRTPHAVWGQASANLSRYTLPNNFPGVDPASEPEEAVAAQQPTPPPAKPATASSVTASPVTVDWKPPVLGIFLLALVLLTMGAQARPGLFNVLFHPLFLLPFLVTTMGIFVFRWTGHAGGAFDVLALPMPEWHRFVSFPEARTVAMSAAVPLLFSLLSGPLPWLRRFAAGLGVGFSACLAVAAIDHPALALIPPAQVLPWYLGNALVALVLARLVLPPRRTASAARSTPARGRSAA